MFSRIKSIAFAAILCITCSVILTTASTGLQRFQNKNMRIDRHRNILMSVGLIKQDQRVSNEEIESMYKENIRPLWVEPDGQLTKASQRGEKDLPIYVYTKGNEIEAYIL